MPNYPIIRVTYSNISNCFFFRTLQCRRVLKITRIGAHWSSGSSVSMTQRFPNCGAPPKVALLVVWVGGKLFVWGTYLFWTKYGHKIQIYILVGIMLGWKMKLVLFYRPNLNFTRVYINSLVQRSPAERPNKITKPLVWGPYKYCTATDEDVY
jgi:hypothetical protein